MRDFLTGIAILLIVALTTMLVAPYLVDWNSQRGFIETQLTRVLGQKVTIGGDIDLKLLPTPYLRLNQTVIGGDNGPIRIGIHHLDLELSVAPLLHGQFDIIEGRLDEPTIRVSLQPDRTLPALPDTPAFRADVRLERITIVDGTLALADPRSGHTFVVNHLDFSAEAPSLAGPFRGTGAQGRADDRTKFRFSTTTPSKGKTRVHLTVNETIRHPGLDLDGDVALTPADGGRVRQSFQGMAVATGHLNESTEHPIAWRLAGPLEANPQMASLSNGEFRIGSEDAGLSFQADIEGDFRSGAALQVKLAAKQLDIDRLSGAPIDSVKPPPPNLPTLASLRTMLAAVPSVPTIADVRVDAATWGGATLSGLAAHIELGGPTPHSVKVSGDGPGGLHVEADGRLAPGNRFDGLFDVGASDLAAALRWLGSVAPQVPIGANDLPFRSLAVTGHIETSGDRADISDLALSVDRSKLAGSARISLGDSALPANVSADLRTARLDLDALPDLHSLVARHRPFDLALKLDAGAVDIAQVGDGAINAGHVRLDMSAAGQRVVVKDFEAENLGGATVALSGSLDDKTASLTLSIAATRLEQAATLIEQLAPGAPAKAFAARAASLAPAHLKVDARFEADPSGRLTASRLGVTGTAAATRLDVNLAPDQPGHDVKLSANAEAPQGGALLRQLGIETVPVTALGPSHLTIAASGPLDGTLATRVEAAFGKTQFAVDGRFDLFETGPRGSGTASMRSPDATPLLQILSLSPPDAASRLKTDISGGLALGPAGLTLGAIRGRLNDVAFTGSLIWRAASAPSPVLTGDLTVDRLGLGELLGVALGPSKPPVKGATWSSEPFAASVGDTPRSLIRLRATTLDLGFGLLAHDAAFDLGTAPNLVTLTQGQATLAGGRLGGAISLRRDGPQATLEGSLAIDKAALDLPAIKGTLSAKLDLAGGGTSALALTSSLAGTGDAALADIKVAGADPRAVPRVFAAVENDTLAVDDESVRRAFDEAAIGPLAAGERHFTLSLAGGALAMSPRDGPVAAGPVAATLGGSLDLRRPRLQIDVGETLKDLPKNWSGPPPTIIVTLAGPPDSPTRHVNVSSFINALAARAIARESARIESYEFDIRERAFFNARLQSDERREEDRLRSAAAAEAARRAKADAARLEKQRQDQADRDAKGKPMILPGARPSMPGEQRSDVPPGTTTNPSTAEPN